MRALVTGGSGFVGSTLIDMLLKKTGFDVINVDLREPGEGSVLHRIGNHTRYYFEKTNICSQKRMDAIFDKYRPTLVFNLANESNINPTFNSRHFLQTNIYGTYVLLEASKNYIKRSLPKSFRFIYVSGDEVYGDCESPGKVCNPRSYLPKTPFAASKASAELLCSSWGTYYGIPIIITHSTANYGERQLSGIIPFVLNALIQKEKVTITNGEQVQNWLHVEDHCQGLLCAAKFGTAGSVYNFGSDESWTMIQVVTMIGNFLNELFPTRQRQGSSVKYIDGEGGSKGMMDFNLMDTMDQLIWYPSKKFMPSLKKIIQYKTLQYLADRSQPNY